MIETTVYHMNIMKKCLPEFHGVANNIIIIIIIIIII